MPRPLPYLLAGLLALPGSPFLTPASHAMPDAMPDAISGTLPGTMPIAVMPDSFASIAHTPPTAPAFPAQRPEEAAGSVSGSISGETPGHAPARPSALSSELTSGRTFGQTPVPASGPAVPQAGRQAAMQARDQSADRPSVRITSPSPGWQGVQYYPEPAPPPAPAPDRATTVRLLRLALPDADEPPPDMGQASPGSDRSAANGTAAGPAASHHGGPSVQAYGRTSGSASGSAPGNSSGRASDNAPDRASGSISISPDAFGPSGQSHPIPLVPDCPQERTFFGKDARPAFHHEPLARDPAAVFRPKSHAELAAVMKRLAAARSVPLQRVHELLAAVPGIRLEARDTGSDGALLLVLTQPDCVHCRRAGQLLTRLAPSFPVIFLPVGREPASRALYLEAMAQGLPPAAGPTGPADGRPDGLTDSRPDHRTDRGTDLGTGRGTGRGTDRGPARSTGGGPRARSQSPAAPAGTGTGTAPAISAGATAAPDMETAIAAWLDEAALWLVEEYAGRPAMVPAFVWVSGSRARMSTLSGRCLQALVLALESRNAPRADRTSQGTPQENPQESPRQDQPAASGSRAPRGQP